MNTKNMILIIVLAAMVLGVWMFVSQQRQTTQVSGAQEGHHDVYYCPMHPHYTSDKPGACPICQMKLVKKEGNPKAELQQQAAGSQNEHKVLYYRNPMDSSITSPVFMKDSMGMDYIPVYEDEKVQNSSGLKGYATIFVPMQKQQMIGLKTAIVSKKTAFKNIRAAGYVSTNHDLYMFQDEYVKAYMDFVTNYRDYRRFKHSRRNWEPHRELQMKLHEAEDKLLRLGLGHHQIEQLQKFSWKTPWDQPDLLFLKDRFEYWVMAQIFEKDLGFVEVGQDADIEISGYGEKAKGVIRSIGGTVNPETRTANALIELKGYRGELKGNMFVNVSIPVQLNEVIAVPREAVMDTGVRKVIFVQKNEGTFEPRVIETGWETDDGFEVKSGLKVGEKIVTSGNFLLDSESRVQAGLEDGGDSHGQ